MYKKEELNDDAAIKIIDGTNIYRDFSRLPRKIQVEISRSLIPCCNMDIFNSKYLSGWFFLSLKKEGCDKKWRNKKGILIEI